MFGRLTSGGEKMLNPHQKRGFSYEDGGAREYSLFYTRMRPCKTKVGPATKPARKRRPQWAVLRKVHFEIRIIV
jgi:hypothetical protein